MENKMKIDENSLDILCKKAAISLKKKEKEEILSQLNSIADLFDHIITLTVTKADFTRHETILQNDVADTFQNTQGITKNAPSKEDNFILSPVTTCRGNTK